MEGTTKKGDTSAASNIANVSMDQSSTQNQQLSSYKIVHKDQDAIYGFCINEVRTPIFGDFKNCYQFCNSIFFQRDKNMLALCTNKEIIEMDMRNLLVKNPQLDDECEIDILALQT